MEILPLIKEIGGGLPSVVIVILGWVVGILWRKVGELQEKLLQSTIESVKLQNDVVNSLGAMASTYKELAAEIRADRQ